MNRSEDIKELAAAMSEFQGNVVDAVKEKSGYGYKYAELGGVLEIVRPLLKQFGLSIMQLVGTNNNNVSLETVLTHKSGQWISSTLEIPAEDKKGLSHAQTVGTAITYMRRYALCSLLGIAQVDDDAAESKPKEARKDGYTHKIEKKDNTYKQKLSPEQVNVINDLIGDSLDIYDKILTAFKVESVGQIEARYFDGTVARIKQIKQEQSQQDIVPEPV